MELKDPQSKRSKFRLEPKSSLPLVFGNKGELTQFHANLTTLGSCIADPIEIQIIHKMVWILLQLHRWKVIGPHIHSNNFRAILVKDPCQKAIHHLAECSSPALHHRSFGKGSGNVAKRGLATFKNLAMRPFSVTIKENPAKFTTTRRKTLKL